MITLKQGERYYKENGKWYKQQIVEVKKKKDIEWLENSLKPIGIHTANRKNYFVMEKQSWIIRRWEAMLKIKDNIELKNLEKFGFEFIEQSDQYEWA